MKDSKEVFEKTKEEKLKKMEQQQANAKAASDTDKPRLLLFTLNYHKECFLDLFETQIAPLPDGRELEAINNAYMPAIRR